jgi:hypothetical protein
MAAVGRNLAATLLVRDIAMAHMTSGGRIDRLFPRDDALQLVIEGDNNDTGSTLLFVATGRVQRLLCRGGFSSQRRTAAPGVRRHHGRGRDQEK